MTKKDFPREVTKENLDDLTERAEEIRKKSLQLRYVFAIVVPYVMLGILVFFGSMSLVFWLAQNHYLDFLLWFPPEMQIKLFFVLLFAIVIAIFLPTLTFLLLLGIWLLRKYSEFPKHKEVIFAECFVIAKHLTDNERLMTKKEVGYFLACLTAFVRDWFNPKRKVYAPEFNSLRSGKNTISRMLMFSKDEVSALLRDFGLAFVRDDSPEAFSHLKQLINKAEEYGELKGRFRRFLSTIEQYPHALPWILTIILIVAALIYYLVSGQRLPLG